LGIGGLVSAYKTVAKEVLENATIIEKTVQNFYELYFDYEIMAEVMQVVKQNQLHIEKQVFETTCFIEISIRQKEALHLEGLLEKINNLTFKKSEY
jgi:putative IMPACT (imprinted ancient) family translation regulator